MILVNLQGKFRLDREEILINAEGCFGKDQESGRKRVKDSDFPKQQFYNKAIFIVELHAAALSVHVGLTQVQSKTVTGLALGIFAAIIFFSDKWKVVLVDAGAAVADFYWVIDIREGFPKFMRVSPEGLALFLVEFVRVIREGCS